MKLPHNSKIEKIVIAILLLNKKIILDVMYILHTNYFYNLKNKLLYKSIKKIYLKYKKVEILTLIDYLNVNNKIDFLGGKKYIIKIINKIVDSSYLKHYINILKKKYILRELIKMSNSIIKDSYKDDIEILTYLYTIEKKIFSLLKNNQEKNFYSIKEILNKIENKIILNKTCNKGILSGFKQLDAITNG
ncbi:MAG: DnaB-like helicase N-terminal domain-containing protein [Candidatus Shikimatogenerans sp. Tser]|uniref:DnaB-like helicase N-terminal domain-containing protein n=1 Tax=Candidatus Shikimatogenerans sp. Tser TaxID=3158568 RepID=A0AAU7QR13_9FLAO